MIHDTTTYSSLGIYRYNGIIFLHVYLFNQRKRRKYLPWKKKRLKSQVYGIAKRK